jgi:hypothetical protein
MASTSTTRRSGGPSRRAFTVIEVVIVVVLVVLIIILSLPATSRAHSRAVQAQARVNLLHLGVGMHGYHDTRRQFADNGKPGSWADPLQPSSGSWLYQITPFIEQDAVFRNPMGHKALVIPTVLCPARERQGFTTMGAHAGPVTDYAINCWLGDTVTGQTVVRTPSRLTSITDGTSNTFMIGQAALLPAHYQATDATPGRDTFLVGGTKGTGRGGARLLHDEKASLIDHEFGSPFPQGSFFCMADASVRMFSYNVDLTPGLRPNDNMAAPADIDGNRW